MHPHDPTDGLLPLLCAAGFLIPAIAVLAWRGFQALAARRLVEGADAHGAAIRQRVLTTACAPFAKFEEGVLVRVRGVVETFNDTLDAPFSGVPCVGYRVVMAQPGVAGVSLVPGRDGKEHLDTTGRSPTEIEARTVSFLLTLNDGAVRIDASNSVSFGHLKDSYGRTAKNEERVSRYFANRGIAEYDLSSFATEFLVLPNARIDVVGVLRRERSSEQTDSYRGADSEWVLGAPKDGEMLITATP